MTRFLPILFLTWAVAAQEPPMPPEAASVEGGAELVPVVVVWDASPDSVTGYAVQTNGVEALRTPDTLADVPVAVGAQNAVTVTAYNEHGESDPTAAILLLPQWETHVEIQAELVRADTVAGPYEPIGQTEATEPGYYAARVTFSKSRELVLH